MCRRLLLMSNASRRRPVMNRGAILAVAAFVVVAGCVWCFYYLATPARARERLEDSGDVVISDNDADAVRLSSLFRGSPRKVSQTPSSGQQLRKQQQQQKTSRNGTSSGSRRRVVAAYIKQAQEATEVAWQFISSKDGWSKEADGPGKDPGTVYSKINEKYGKMFKLTALLDVEPQLIHEDLAVNAANMPKWNPTLIQVKVVEALDNQTAVMYNVAAPAAGGMVSSRDFVFLSRRMQRDGWYTSCIVSTTHSAAPPLDQYVRGEQAPGCMRFQAAEAGRSRMEWVLNTDLKGWLTQYMVDNAMSGVLLSYLDYLRKHCGDLKTSQTNRTV